MFLSTKILHLLKQINQIELKNGPVQVLVGSLRKQQQKKFIGKLLMQLYVYV